MYWGSCCNKQTSTKPPRFEGSFSSLLPFKVQYCSHVLIRQRPGLRATGWMTPRTEAYVTVTMFPVTVRSICHPLDGRSQSRTFWPTLFLKTLSPKAFGTAFKLSSTSRGRTGSDNASPPSLLLSDITKSRVSWFTAKFSCRQSQNHGCHSLQHHSHIDSHKITDVSVSSTILISIVSKSRMSGSTAPFSYR